MNVGIAGTGLTPSSQNNLKKILDDSGIEYSQIGSKSKTRKPDCVIVLGGDRGVRNYFHRTFDATIPVLGINESESNGFLAQIDLKEFATYVKKIKKIKFQN